MPLTCPALDQTVLPLGIVRALGTAAATATTTAAVVVTGDHATPREAIPTADVTGVTPEGGPFPVTHHDPGPLGIATISHGPAECINPITEVDLDPQGGAPAINPVLQIASIPGIL